MSTFFKKAPLVEIVAELKWKSAFETPPSFNLSEKESFYKRFSGAIEKMGYVVSERLLPSEFPAPPEMVVYRFKKLNDNSSLMHIGDGVFSVNALPPYKTWEDFRPTVQQSIEALLETRDDSEKTSPFLSINLRYIDVFKAELFNGVSDRKFMSEDLAFKQSIPSVLEGLLEEDDTQSRFSLTAPFKDFPKTLRLQIGRNIAHNNPGVGLDMVISEKGPINGQIGEIMAVLDSSHTLQRDIFLGMTKSISERMEPATE